MLTRRKRHWATLLAIGLPLLVGGCASSGMTTPTASLPGQASPTPTNPLALAERLKAEGNISSAVSMYQQAHQVNPGDIRPLIGLADCLLAMSANADAAEAYGAALSIEPNNLDALRGLGHTRILLGQPQFAVTQYQTAVRIAPKDLRSLNGLGVAQDMVGDHRAAQSTYKQVLALDPSNQSAKNNLALSLALTGDNAGAIKILEELSKSAGSTAVNRQNLALVYGVSGQIDQAREASRADLSEGAVEQNMAAMSASTNSATQQQLLKQSLGVELKGRQYAAAAKPVMPLTNLAQASVNDEPVYLSGTDGASMPVITTGKRTQTAATSVELTTKTVAKRSTGDDWSDEWDEELVDATDVESGPQTAAVATPADEPKPSAPAAKSSPFLSSSNAIADDKAPAASAEAKAPPVASATIPKEATPATQPAAASEEQPAATPAKTEPAKLTPTTETVASAATVASTSTAVTATQTAAASTSPAVTTTQIAAAKVYTVQLASYRSEAEATAGWQTLTTEQQDLLAKLPHAVAKADLGADKGIYYRLQAGAFGDRQAAKALCSDLQTRSIDCMVVEATSAESPAPAKTQQSMVRPDNSFVIGAR
jgi:Flp pilus assembly protein TadD